jgi:hypothetical protein
MYDPADDEFPLLSANDPCSDVWDEGASFLGLLMESSLFDDELYAELEATMIRAVAEGPDFQTLGAIIRIIERITLMARRHLDPGDVYRIGNLDDSQVIDMDQRIRFCLTEISLGNAPDMSRAGD